MRRVRSRLTILLLILVIVTSLFSLTFGALVRNGIIFQQRDNIRYLVFGYAAKDILLLLIAVAAVAVLITVTSARRRIPSASSPAPRARLPGAITTSPCRSATAWRSSASLNATSIL